MHQLLEVCMCGTNDPQSVVREFSSSFYRTGCRLSTRRAAVWSRRLAILAMAVGLCGQATAQATGNAGSITGAVSDPTGAVVPGATVQIHNPVSEFTRSTTTDSSGKFSF